MQVLEVKDIIQVPSISMKERDRFYFVILMQGNRPEFYMLPNIKRPAESKTVTSCYLT